MSESMLTAAFIILSGGLQDAYTYLCRGKVFANAQTGNIVLFGANIAEGNWLRAAEYFLPILAFALGVVAAEIVKRRYKKRQSDINIHWRQIVVLVEIVLLIAAAFLPQTLNTTVNIMISFICAMQVESFRKVRGSAFATTMCTGNLRSAADNLYAGLALHDAPALLRASRYLSVVLVFVLGAVAGAFLTQALAEKAVLLCTLPLLAAFGVMFLPTGEAAP